MRVGIRSRVRVQNAVYGDLILMSFSRKRLQTKRPFVKNIGSGLED